MSKTNTWESDLLLLLFNNTPATLIGDAAGLLASAGAGSLYVSLHSADPGEAGVQNTSEIVYTSYARVGVARSGAGWTKSGTAPTQVANAALVAFPACTGLTDTATFFGVGTDASGAGKLLYRGALGSYQGPFTAKTDDTITIPGHGLSVDDRIVFVSSPPSAFPTGLTESTIYWVKTVSGNDITISATQGGAAIDVTVAGDGFAYKDSSLAISSGITPQFAIGALVITED